MNKSKKTGWGQSSDDDFSIGTGMAEKARKALKNRKSQLDDLLGEVEAPKPKKDSKQKPKK